MVKHTPVAMMRFATYSTGTASGMTHKPGKFEVLTKIPQGGIRRSNGQTYPESGVGQSYGGDHLLCQGGGKKDERWSRHKMIDAMKDRYTAQLIHGVVK